MTTPGNMMHRWADTKNTYKRLNSTSTIILAIGNNGRRDDGLGWAFMEALEKQSPFRGHVEYRYQLQVEDAALVAEYANVIFVDAHRGKLDNGFSFERTEAGREFAFSTHIIPPPSVLFLTRELYENEPVAFTLAIEGAEWELKNGLSEKARNNLENALQFFHEQVLCT